MPGKDVLDFFGRRSGDQSQTIPEKGEVVIFAPATAGILSLARSEPNNVTDWKLKGAELTPLPRSDSPR